MKKKGIIAVLAIAMTSAIASMATGCKLVDNIKQKIEQAKCEHATEVVTEMKPATCTESGLTEGVKCGDCDKWIVEPDEIPALGHELVKDEAVPATCLKSGLTEGSHCSRCEETVKKQETVKAPGHKLVAVEAKEATCTENGYTAGQKCEACGVVYQGCEETLATGHIFGDDGYCKCGEFSLMDVAVGTDTGAWRLEAAYRTRDTNITKAQYEAEILELGRDCMTLGADYLGSLNAYINFGDSPENASCVSIECLFNGDNANILTFTVQCENTASVDILASFGYSIIDGVETVTVGEPVLERIMIECASPLSSVDISFNGNTVTDEMENAEKIYDVVRRLCILSIDRYC